MSYDNHNYSDLANYVCLPSLHSLRDYHDILLLYKIIYEYVDSFQLSQNINLNLNMQTLHLRNVRPFDFKLVKNNFINESFIDRSSNFVNSSNSIIRILENKLYSFKTELKRLM